MFEFWRFKPVDLTVYTKLDADITYSLVFLSVFVAALAAYASLVVLNRAWASNNQKSKSLWLIFGALVMGTGVWSMHFTGMLAYMVPTTMTYNLPLTTLSVIPAMLGAYYALNEMAKFHFSFLQVQRSALSLALGIGAMHFIGMEAMQTDALMRYRLDLFLLSLIAAHVQASIALYVVVYSYKSEKNKGLSKVLSAFVMGTAISGMHYIATAAASFYMIELPTEHVHTTNLGLSFVIATVIVIFVATTVLCSIVEQRFDDTALLALQSSIREKFIIEHMVDGLLVIESTGGAILANNAIRKMFHLNDGQEKCSLSSIIPEFTYQKLLEDVELERPNIINKILPCEGVKQDGVIFPLEVRFSTMPIFADTERTFNCIVSDLTSKVEMEVQLRQAQKLESMGQLAAGIAHEINTPTQFVSDNTTFLKDAFIESLSVLNQCNKLTNKPLNEVSEEEWTALKSSIENADLDFISEEVPSAFDQSVEGLQRISSIVKAMKSFSHPSKGHAEPADLKEVLETTITVARNEWRYVAELTTEFDENLPSILCIRDELSQVFLNIIVNATHAIEDQCAQSDQTSGNIHIKTSEENGNAKIAISDNGSGMKQEVLKRMFDPFFTTKEVGKGTGQGLNMAYAVIVEKHKGKIKAESQLGKGTTFIITLPINNVYLEEECEFAGEEK
ncbi:MAG: MHYT domain-containing protein [Colwellia sp.]